MTAGLGLLPTFGPVLLALLLGWGCAFAGRRRVFAGVAAAVGAAAGWAVLVHGGWRGIVWPRGGVEYLVLPAVGFVLAGLVGQRVQSRWVGFAGVGFAAWWLAWMPAARPEFYRVLFGAAVVAWVLGRVGAREPRLAAAVALTVAGGLVLGGAAVPWVVAELVLVAVCCGVWVGGAGHGGRGQGERGGAVPVGLVMVGAVGAVLASGRMVRGGLGVVDIAGVLALLAPLLVPGVERRLGRLRVGGVVAVACGLAGMAWILARAVRA